MRGPDRQFNRDEVYELMNKRTDPREPWTVQEVAEQIGCSTSTAYSRLRELKTQGRIKTKSVSSSGRVWWINKPIEDMDTDGTHEA